MAARSEDTRKIQLQEGLEVDHIDILTDLLITERRSVLFVGEGDFSCTVAFAALRKAKKSRSTGANPGTWEGITATRLEPETERPAVAFSDAIDTCKAHCQNTKKVRKLEKLAKEPPPEPWIYDIDACHLRDHREHFPRPEVIWFQCPWVNRDTYSRPGTSSSPPSDTYSLILRFLASASHNLQPGGHTCIGISTSSYKDYVKAYKLQKLCGDVRDETLKESEKDILSRYEFLGADDELVESILQFGYHHKSITTNDIHDLIRDCHVTLVFRRKSTSQCSRY